jgi:hypothetical protein
MLTFPSEDARSSFGAAPGNTPIGKERDTVPHYVYDASLLFRRMEMHQIDPTHLAHRDPLLFRELQALCTLCPSKDRCAGDNLSDTMSEASGAYCPNVKTFIALGDRAQKIFLPGTSGDTRLGPQQYYYISSKGGVVPHWWVESARRTAQYATGTAATQLHSNARRP